MSGLNTQAIIDAVATQAMTTGRFDVINTHEAKNGPGNQMVCDITVRSGRALAMASGLSVTSCLLTLSVVCYCSMLQDPQDTIDTQLNDCVDDLCNLYVGGFTLGGLIRNVDVLGQFGQELAWTFGHIDISKQAVRAAEIMLPLVVNDAWTETA
jgi:hypothetical protein